MHPSLLPRWRGAAPIERAIMAGDARTGVSIMRLTAGLDSGPVCLTRVEPIDAARHLRLAGGRACSGSAASCSCARWTLTARGQSPAFVEQDEAGVTYAEKIGPEDRLLDPARPARELERVVRALHPAHRRAPVARRRDVCWACTSAPASRR